MVPVDVQTAMYLASRKLVERASRWLLHHRRRPLPVATTVELFGDAFARLAVAMPTFARGAERDRLATSALTLTEQGVPAELAARVAALDLLSAALDITELAALRTVDVEHVAELYAVAGDRLRLDWLRDRVVELPRADRWDALARNALREDVAAAHRAIVDAVLAVSESNPDAPAAFDAWAAGEDAQAERTLAIIGDISTQGVFDLATLSVALRALRALV
jgi:glutamate dehydrogenase